MAQKSLGNPYGFSAENPYKYNTAAGLNWEKSQKVLKDRAAKKEKAAEAATTAEQTAADAKAAASAQEIRDRIAQLTPKPIESVADVGPKETKEALALRQQQLAGFNAPQLAAMQAQMASGQQAAEQQRNRALQAALAKQGIRGGSAASLQAQAAQQAARERAGGATDLMLKQAEEQKRALGEYEKSVQGSLGLAQRQQFAELAAGLTGEQLISAEKLGGLQAGAIKDYASAMQDIYKDKGKVICTELHRQGLMSSTVFMADQEFGRKQDSETMIGYHVWALPVVKLMKASKIVTWITHKIATPWAEQMAFEMGVLEKPNMIGAAMMAVGIPVCRAIGMIVKKVAYGRV